MKHYIAVLVIALIATSCGTMIQSNSSRGYDTSSTEKTNVGNSRVATDRVIDLNDGDELEQYLREQQWGFALKQLMARYPLPNFNAYGFGFKIEDDYIDCYLPFYGRSYRSSYGYGNPMRFKTKMIEYKINRSRRDNNEVEVKIMARNYRNIITFYISVYPNGSCHVNMSSQETEGCAYIGDLVLTELKTE